MQRFRDGGSSPVSTKTSRSLMVSRAPAIAGHFTGAAIRPKDTATYDKMQRETRLGDCSNCGAAFPNVWLPNKVASLASCTLIIHFGHRS